MLIFFLYKGILRRDVMIIEKHMKWKLYALNFFVFVAISMVNTQMIPYLTKLGYNVVERGWILAGNAIVSIVGQFLFGYLCDRFQKIRRFFLLAYLLLVAASFAMFLYQDKVFYYHIFTVSMMGGMVKVIMGLDETWMLELDREHYGVLRSFGALGLTVGSPIAGYLVSHFSYISLLFSFSGISILLFYLMKTSADAKKQGNAICMKDIKGFFKNQRYVLLVLIYLLIYMIGTADQYVVIDKMLHIHASSTQVGIKWALQSFMEAPLFLMSGKILKKFKPFTLLWFGTIMYGIKFFLYGFFQSPWWIIATAGLQIVTLPIIMLTSKLLIREVSDEKVASSAQMFAMAVFIGFSGLITPLITSFLANAIGYDMTLYVVAAFTIVPFLLIFYYRKIDQKKT